MISSPLTPSGASGSDDTDVEEFTTGDDVSPLAHPAISPATDNTITVALAPCTATISAGYDVPANA